ncbi:MAG: LPS-assembly protein LptD, partial [Rhodospirillaceae bacterium]|nr:LPS-assembly protein LptD [Rhodospirillaceae bacterium]
MRRGIFIAALILAGLWGPPAIAQERPSSSEPVLLSADEVSYNEDLGIVVASGSVEIAQGDRVVLADRVTYNERENTVSANGHVSLLEPGGEVVFAEYMELADDMKNGVVRDLRILLTDNSRIAAAGGRLQGGVRTEMRKAVFSPCELCEDDPEAAPLWQIKAVKVVHDQRTHDIEYTDAWMEMYGVPVFYTPYFSHPDPTVKRRSGLLTPDFGNDSQLGMLLRTPYFFTMGPDKDATITPIFTTKERVALAAEYRQRFTSGEFETDGSFTRV